MAHLSSLTLAEQSAERQHRWMAQISHVVGPTDPPLLEHTIGEALIRAAARWPGAEALVSVHQQIRWSWSELAARVDAVAAGLLALGLEPGDRVGVWAPNCAEWVVAQYATARAGMIQVNVNPAYRADELEYTLRTVGVKALICAERFKTSDYVAMVEALAPEIAACPPGRLEAAGAPALRWAIQIGGAPRPGWLAFDALAGQADERWRRRLGEIAAGLSNRDAINIQFTSGTTGRPKGATLSHRNILNNAYLCGRAMGLRDGDRLCIPVPLYHCFGMVMGSLACTVHGATMVYPSEGFDPEAVLRVVAAERCTALHGVPTMFIAELEHAAFDSFDLSSLRTGLMAGSPCPVEVMRKVIDRMHMTEVGIAYGMTETSPVSLQTAGDDSLERRVSTVGQVLPHLEVKIIDAQGAAVPRGQPGELCTRGYSVMLGYWDDAENTAKAIDPDGWMHTGDLATLDEAGYGNIVGRIKDLVIRGGENVYPREIEAFLFGHPKVEDVQVVGVPDPKFGEELCAWIKLRAGESACEADIHDFCRDHIAHYKIPRYVRFVDAFPMTVTGKIQKFEIRAAMIAELKLATQVTA
jgi:fatty-acyl-CoA synthase